MSISCEVCMASEAFNTTVQCGDTKQTHPADCAACLFAKKPIHSFYFFPTNATNKTLLSKFETSMVIQNKQTLLIVSLPRNQYPHFSLSSIDKLL